MVMPPELQEVDQALGFIIDDSISFSSLVTDELVKEFKEWVVDHKEDFTSQGLSKERQELFGIYDHKFETGSSVYHEESLRDWLIEQGLAKIEWADKKKFGLDRYISESGYSMYLEESKVYLPKNIALHYLSLCASKAALDGNRDLVTGEEVFTDIIFHQFRRTSGQVASNVLQAYLPKNFDSLEPSRIAEFRKVFSVQRLKYQQSIQSLCQEFTNVASEGQLSSIARQVEQLAKEEIEETRKVYNHAKIEESLKVFSLTLAPPAIATSLASILGSGIFVPAGIVATLLLFGAGTILALEKAKNENKKSPWSYIQTIGGLKA